MSTHVPRQSVVEATEERIRSLATPDVALVALAYRLAAMLDDPETATAAGAKEYRATMLALTAQEAKEEGLDDLLDAD